MVWTYYYVVKKDGQENVSVKPPRKRKHGRFHRSWSENVRRLVTHLNQIM